MTDSYRYSSEFAEECERFCELRERKQREALDKLFRKLEHAAINNDEIRSILQAYEQELKID